jgi:hypothetical protein
MNNSITCRFCNNLKLFEFKNVLSQPLFKCLNCNVLYYYDNITVPSTTFSLNLPTNHSAFFNALSYNNMLPEFYFDYNINNHLHLWKLFIINNIISPKLLYSSYEGPHNISPSNFDKKLKAILTFL